MTTEINNNSLIVPSLTATNISVTGTIYGQGGVEIGSGGTASLYVENGKVGVNTETPNEHLTVVGNISASNDISASGSIYSQGGVEIGSGGTASLYVENGKVGVNTETPNERLTVVGNISATELFYASGGDSSKWNSSFSTVQANSATEWTSAITTTYSQLTSLKSSNSLVPGQTYIISDFQTKWWKQKIGDVTVMTSPVVEPLLVTAVTSNSIHSLAKSSLYPGDILTYDIDAFCSNFEYASEQNVGVPIPQFKGWIYNRHDVDRNILMPFDWRHITVPCYKLNLSAVPTWGYTTMYARGNIILYNGRLYVSIRDGNQSNPPQDTGLNWRRLSPFIEENTYIPSNTPNESYTFSNPAMKFTAPTVNSSTNFNLNPATYIEQPVFSNTITGIGNFDLSDKQNITVYRGSCLNVFTGFIKDLIVKEESNKNIIGECTLSTINQFSDLNVLYDVVNGEIGTSNSYIKIIQGEDVKTNMYCANISFVGYTYNVQVGVDSQNLYLNNCQYFTSTNEFQNCSILTGANKVQLFRTFQNQTFVHPTNSVENILATGPITSTTEYGTSSTHVYNANYAKTITRNTNGNSVLQYVTSTNVLTGVGPAT